MIQPKLDDFLGRAYAATHGLSGDSILKVVTQLVAAMHQYPALRIDALNRLGSLTDDICDRDHISRVSRDFLRAVLEDQDDGQ